MTSLSLSAVDLATLATDAVVIATTPAGGRRRTAAVTGPASG